MFLSYLVELVGLQPAVQKVGRVIFSWPMLLICASGYWFVRSHLDEACRQMRENKSSRTKR